MYYPPLSLERILERSALSSIRGARSFIQKRDVRVNGGRCTDGKTLVFLEKDKVSVDGEPLFVKNDVYLMLNKPSGTVCTNFSDRHKTVFDIISDEYKNVSGLSKLHSVGRLDADTEGLVILTTNGKLSHNLTAPESHVPKTYLVYLKNEVSSEERALYEKKFAEGIFIAAEKKAKAHFSAPAFLEWIDSKEHTSCLLTISEGKFHQVKRMFRSLLNEVVYLKRIAIGSLELDTSLKLGEYRKLSAEEVSLLS